MFWHLTAPSITGHLPLVGKSLGRGGEATPSDRARFKSGELPSLRGSSGEADPNPVEVADGARSEAEGTTILELPTRTLEEDGGLVSDAPAKRNFSALMYSGSKTAASAVKEPDLATSGGDEIRGDESESASETKPARGDTSALDPPLSSFGLLLSLLILLLLLLSLKDGTNTEASALKE